MEKATKIVKHQGKDIILVNYRGLRADAYSAAIKEVKKKYKELTESGKKDLLICADATDSVLGPEQWELEKKNISYIRTYVKGMAVIGVTGYKRFFFKIGSRFFANVKSFNSVDEALDWLVKL